MPQTVIFGVLNWGLGHASRSIPLLRAFLERGLRVIVASDGEAGALLRDEFPALSYVALPAYAMAYTHESIARNVVPRLPALLHTMRQENALIQGLAARERAVAIVSDNRYGVYVPGLPSVLVLHQLNLVVRPPWLGRLANAVHRRALRPFSAIWVPDEVAFPGLAGSLSHPARPLACPVRYLGVVSRMKAKPLAPEWDVVAVLSGPEPQRTVFEARILAELALLEGRHLVVRGKPLAADPVDAPPHVSLVPYLTTQALNEALLSARAIVCRSGYSSVMDLAALGKPALFVPTPGQTEQEVVADALAGTGRGVVQVQHRLNLRQGLAQLHQLPTFPPFGIGAMEQVVDEWLSREVFSPPVRE